MRRPLFALAACFAALLAPSAHAATVRVVEIPSDRNPGYSSVTVEAPGAEANAISVRTPSRTRMLISASAGALTPAPGGGCTQESPAVVSCPTITDSEPRLDYSLDDGEDRVEFEPAATLIPSGSLGAGNDTALALGQVDGGPGDDALTAASGAPAQLDGGAGADTLVGAGGDDALEGGGGRDTMRGAGGDDRLADGDTGVPDADTMDGGPGSDMLDYGVHTVSVRVDLRRPGAGFGAAGENDTAVSMENARGGEANDVLTGTAGANRLSGDGGRDVLRAGGGRDELSGGSGGDRLDGGAGPDYLDGDDGRDRVLGGSGNDQVELGSDPRLRADRVSCGSGRKDSFSGTGSSASPPRRCELAEGFEGMLVRAGRIRVRGGMARVRVRCPGGARIRGGCRGRITLRSGRRTLGSDRFRAREGRSTTAVVPIRGPVPRFAALLAEASFPGTIDTTFDGPQPGTANDELAFRVRLTR